MTRDKQLTHNEIQQHKADRRVTEADYILWKYNIPKSWYILDPKMPPNDIDNILEEIDKQ
jgi:hypothetical protein